MSDCQGAEVLIVDDTPANLKLMRDALTPAGYEISVATSGAAALKTASFSRPDLILLDVQMPEMDGYETCRQLKAAAETREIPVVFITARDAREGALEGFRAGGVDFISKPVEEEEVLARVRTHLEINYLRGRGVFRHLRPLV